MRHYVLYLDSHFAVLTRTRPFMKPKHVVIWYFATNVLSVFTIMLIFSLHWPAVICLLSVSAITTLVLLKYATQGNASTPYLSELVAALLKDDNIDLTYRFNEADANTPPACLAINASLATIEHLIGEVYCSSSRLSPMADSLRDTYSSMTQKATIQHAHGTDLATSFNRMISVARELDEHLDQIYGSVTEATNAVKKTRVDTGKSQESLMSLANNIQATSTQIESLKVDSDAISSVIDVINSIADQTNLLALNAAIEAARAGEQGRGFAVVADEVRSLAARTSQSTQQVRDMVSKIQAGTDSAHNLMLDALSETQQTVSLSQASTREVDQIEQAMIDINTLSKSIHEQVSRQKAVSDEAQMSIDSMVELNSDALNNSQIQAVSSNDLINLARSIHAKLSIFKVDSTLLDHEQRADESRLHKVAFDESMMQQNNSNDIELF